VARQQIPTKAPLETLDRIVGFFKSAPAPAAIGIGSFGPVDLRVGSPHWGAVGRTSKAGWSHAIIAPTLEREIGIPVSIDTDTAVAALGEYRWGAGIGAESLCYITVGTGIGAGLLLNGRPWHGIVHPEIGHARIPHDLLSDPFTGVCPYHGDCLEGLASGPAIAARWGARAETLAPDHPAWVLEAEYLATAIANVILTVGPHRIIIGGGVLEQSHLLATIRARIGEQLGNYLQTPFLDAGLRRYLVAPALGDDSGVLGAIAMAQQSSAGSGERAA
jgi:fructokinase